MKRNDWIVSPQFSLLHFPVLIILVAVILMLASCGGQPSAGQAPSVAANTPAAPATRSTAAAVSPGAAKYIVIGWNDLGMHCYDRDYSAFGVLPPYNNLWAQVIRVGDPPALVTDTVTVEYSFVDNSRSDNKTNFWQYANALFGVELQPNVGLTGKGLAGTMDAAGSHFVAQGVPLTEFLDSAPDQPDYFQTAHLTVKDKASGAVLAETSFVAPISSEMRCDTCHGQGGGDFRQNILSLHDREEGTSLSGQTPVLCAKCHADPALGMAGQPGLPTLSAAMHGKHAEEGEEVDPTKCYACHPGPQTQCLRGVMAQKGMWCTGCHGNISQVADRSRTPWVTLPQCGASICHGSAFAENAGQLYRNSTGHGGLYCEACHNSTHAILPSREAKDNQQVVALQGQASQLSQCTVCHQTAPGAGGPHK